MHAMRGWLVLACLIPLAAAADPAPPAPLRAATPPPSFVVPPPPPMIDASTGWSWRATADGRTLDLEAPDAGWLEGGVNGPHEIVAGYVWREEGQSVVLGYENSGRNARPDERAGGRLFTPRPWRAEPDVLGLSLRIQTGR